MRIDIPEDAEAAFEEAFPGEDKAAAILHLIRTEIARRRNLDPSTEEDFVRLVEEVLRLGGKPPYFTNEDIREAREKLRE